VKKGDSLMHSFFSFVAVKMVLIAIVISEFVVIPAPYSFLPISYL